MLGLAAHAARVTRGGWPHSLLANEDLAKWGEIAHAVIVALGKKPFQEVIRTAGSRRGITEGIEVPKGFGALLLDFETQNSPASNDLHPAFIDLGADALEPADQLVHHVEE
jgi:hypothetical protein